HSWNSNTPNQQKRLLRQLSANVNTCLFGELCAGNLSTISTHLFGKNHTARNRHGEALFANLHYLARSGSRGSFAQTAVIKSHHLPLPYGMCSSLWVTTAN